MITGTRHTELHWVFDATEGKKVFGRDAMTEAEAIDLLNNPPLDGFKAEKIAAIKSEAQARIYTKVPAWKQTNLLARSIELRDIKAEREWTVKEAAEDAAIKSLWAAVKQIRLESDTAETAVNAAGTIEEINAVQF